MPKNGVHEEGSYIRDAIFASSDGLITTFAVVAGSYGASLEPSVVIILGFANLFADGFSMASGTFLGVKSEMEFEKEEGQNHLSASSPVKQGAVTFVAFVLSGILPLIPYLFGIANKFIVSLVIVFISMFIVGTFRSRFTKKDVLSSGLETMFVGGFAAVVAFAVGYLIDRYLL